LVVGEVLWINGFIVESVVIVNHLGLSSLFGSDSNANNKANKDKRQENTHQYNCNNREARRNIIIRIIGTIAENGEVAIDVQGTKISICRINSFDGVSI